MTDNIQLTFVGQRIQRVNSIIRYLRMEVTAMNLCMMYMMSCFCISNGACDAHSSTYVDFYANRQCVEYCVILWCVRNYSYSYRGMLILNMKLIIKKSINIDYQLTLCQLMVIQLRYV